MGKYVKSQAKCKPGHLEIQSNDCCQETTKRRVLMIIVTTCAENSRSNGTNCFVKFIQAQVSFITILMFRHEASCNTNVYKL